MFVTNQVSQYSIWNFQKNFVAQHSRKQHWIKQQCNNTIDSAQAWRRTYFILQEREVTAHDCVHGEILRISIWWKDSKNTNKYISRIKNPNVDIYLSQIILKFESLKIPVTFKIWENGPFYDYFFIFFSSFHYRCKNSQLQALIDLVAWNLVKFNKSIHLEAIHCKLCRSFYTISIAPPEYLYFGTKFPIGTLLHRSWMWPLSVVHPQVDVP